jgi:hypothetical protein
MTGVFMKKEKGMKKGKLFYLIPCAFFVFVCGARMPEVKIDRHPAAADYSRLGGPLAAIPKFDPASDEQWQVDLRSKDLSAIDARGSLSDLLYADFDDKTVWPPADKMAAGFDPFSIMELGKDPGLGVRAVHARGFKGKNIGIAIIDQPLLVDHQEYGDCLRLYEEINIIPNAPAQMHGPAVASIAVGKTVGVAPDADLYYLACQNGAYGSGGFAYDFTYLAKAVRRILSYNTGLPPDRKIRVISMSIGWSNGQKGYDDITAAVEEAKKAGILVTSSSLEQTFGFRFHALGREPMADPNIFESYEPGLWLAKAIFGEGSAFATDFSNRLWIPMDSRTTASPTGKNDYVFYREGGWSWVTPYIAGVYALACQADPGITPDRFWQSAMATGRTIRIQHEGKTYTLGPIIDPFALIERIRQ